MNHRRIIESYYRAFRDADKEALRSILVPEFHHMSSFGEWRDRDAMIEAIWPSVGSSWAANLRILGEAPEFVVRYELESRPEVGRPRTSMAEYVRFERDKIATIEVYIGRELG